MREIKFRGKNPATGIWVNGFYVQGVSNGSNKMLEHGILQKGYYPVEVVPETVGQYTGLKDKNGTEIYEGDVLGGSSNSYVYSYVVGFNSKCAMFCCSQIMLDPFKFEYDEASEYCLDNLMLDNLEVIGNIHDNPKLL